MAKKDPDTPKKPGRIKQLIQSYKMTAKADPALKWWLLLTFVLAGFVGFGIALLLLGRGGNLIFPIITGILTGILGVTIVFGRRAEKAAYRSIEGQPGAAAAVLSVLGKKWTSEAAIAFNKHQDVVHRLVGPPGITLVGEGNINRLRSLMRNERRKHERVTFDVPIHEVYIGNDENQVPLTRLNKHVKKLDKAIKPAQMTDILHRLKALDAQRSNIPIPKGPVPTSMKGSRHMMRGR